MTAKLVRENLKHKPMRSLLSVLLIGVPVILILCLVGLSQGMLEDSARRAKGIGADIWVRPRGSSILGGMSGAPLPQALVDRLQAVPHVKLAVGAVNHPIQAPTLNATGVDLKKFEEMSGGLTFIEGGRFTGPNQVLLDNYYATQKGVHAGWKISLLNKEWEVAGVFESGKLARIIFPLEVLQGLTATSGFSQIYLQIDDPKNLATVIEELKRLLPDYPIYSSEEFASLYSASNIPALNEFVWVIVSIGVVIGFAVVCLSMYMAVLQRTREIGILKSLGASNGFILRVILLEALILGLGGALLGILMSFGAWWVIRTFVPASFPMVIVYSWWWKAGLITLIAAALGALYPAISAARHDPIEALAYE